ncbi:TRAP transporter small permease subunit [Rhodobacterales bacterium HKCCE2091]|nr:TRAP transporter small permease subunit [Rhodobacterales bacterium HKCCE2091]
MHRVLTAAARFMALLGGALLTAAILVTVVSIVGRALDSLFHADWLEAVAPGFADWLIALGIGPINGDFELVKYAMAFAIFSFIPLCQITGGHASVDVFTSMMSVRANRVLRLFADVLFAIALVVIATQLYGGFEAKLRSGQTSFLLEMPDWWGYVICIPGAVLSAVIGIYLAAERFRELFTGRDILPGDMEVEE